MSRFLKLTLAYDGTSYAGWQVQREEATLQVVLEKAIEEFTGETLRVVASGRTDAGVHALGQVVSLQTDNELPCDVWLRALNANLPRDVAVLEVAEAPQGFHAIRDATGKRYRYVIQDGPLRDVFLLRYAWFVPVRLNDSAMQRAAQQLLGRHDFASFETSGSPRETTVRTVTDVILQRQAIGSAECLVLEIAADGFLYNMVRAIVGTLVEIGRGGQDPSWIDEVLAARNRKAAGQTAPPQGLFLVSVDYHGERGGRPPPECDPYLQTRLH